MIQETRISLKNHGRIRPANLEDYLENGGYQALKKALVKEREAIIQLLMDSGLRGRGGAGFPSGLKQKFTSESCDVCQERYVVCNADEGEPGTFKDRIIMESDPFLLLEGMSIAAFAIEADKAFVYIRGEYVRSIERVQKAIDIAYKNGYLGKNILGTTFSLDMEIRLGAGSYLCGEELTLLESLEGKRGYPRIKPPFPAEKGLFQKPTLVNNVETLSHLPDIIIKGPDWYKSLGVEGSSGTKIFTVSGPVKYPGYYEVEMGLTLRELIFDICGGMKDGLEFYAALTGGAAGTFLPETRLDTPMDYESLKKAGAVLGSGAVIVMDKEQSMREMMISILEFFKHESCGKCVPCRVGTAHLYDFVNDYQEKDMPEIELDTLVQQAQMMADSCLCPLGQSPILPLASLKQYFPNDL